MQLLPNIRTLIPLVAVVLSVGFVSVDYLIVSNRVASEEVSNFVETLKFSSSTTQGNLNRAIRRGDQAAIKQILLDLNYLPMLQDAYLVNESSQIVQATDRSKLLTQLDDESISKLIDLDRTTKISQEAILWIEERDLAVAAYPIDGPIPADGTSVRPTKWSLIIAMDYTSRLASLKSEVRSAAFVSGGLMLGLVILLSLVVHLVISRRLVAILSVIGRYTDGKKVPGSSFKGSDELAQIGRSVNALISAVEEKQVALEGSRVELENLNRELTYQKSALDEHSIVSITDHRGVITYANDLFCEASGYSREELIGNTHRMLNSGEHDKAFFTDLWQTISSGESWQGQLKNRRKDGSFYWVESTIVPILDKDTQRYRYIAIRTDITSEKRLSESLIDLQKKNRQMYGVIAHELRTPVAAIEMMTHHGPSEWQKDRSLVRNAVKDLLHSIDDMKMLVNPELKRELRLGSTTIDELNAQINSTVASAVALNDIQFKQTAELTGFLASQQFKTDAYRVKACVTNLIRNACLHSEGSTVWCRVDSFVDDQGTQYLRWRVCDDGKGIPEAYQASMFEPFRRSDSKAEGTGLGLHIARSWIRELNGELQYRALNPGSEFTLTLPIVKSDESEEKSASDQNLCKLEDGLAPLKVLFVEDDRLLRMVTAKAFGNLFAVFDQAKDGFEGLQMADLDYDIIITDYFMPNMSGLDLIKKLRQRGDARPIIAATAATIGKETENLLCAGADAVLHKPMTKESLLKTINDLCKKGRLKIESHPRL